jgi:hypothetical protein
MRHKLPARPSDERQRATETTNVGFVNHALTNPTRVARASANAPRPTTHASSATDSFPSAIWPRVAAEHERTS